MTDVEDRFVAECRRQGLQPDQHAMQRAAIDLCGAKLTPDGLIHLPNLGSISSADLVRSMRKQAPEWFASIDSKPSGSASTLTERYAAEIAANQNKPTLDASKFTGITREFIQENQGKSR